MKVITIRAAVTVVMSKFVTPLTVNSNPSLELMTAFDLESWVTIPQIG